MGYKVLRLMEFEYPSVEDADKHMSQWAVPANGSRAFGKGGIIRSSIIQYPIIDDDEAEDPHNVPLVE